MGLREEHRGSVSSGRSLEAGTRVSSKSSLASPASLRHGLDVGAHRVSSTVSLESERYYSAEEEVVSSSENEGTSSLLDSSILSSGGSVERSMLTILEQKKGENKDGTLKGSGTHDSGGNSDEQKTYDKDGTLRPDRPHKTYIEDCSDEEEDDGLSSVTSSTSTLSYTSAPSEQNYDSDETTEDFTLVHLHTHMNQPITSSPLLLNCYMRHLSQFQCHDWLSPGPSHTIYPLKKGLRSVQSEYSLSSASHSMYSATSSWMPHFTKVCFVLR